MTEVLGLVGIDSLADKRPEALSPLQRLRVALARALVIEPEFLILDEPLARLEPRSKAEFRDALRRLHAETETTTLVLTSDPREALGGFSDRLTVIDLGRIVESARPTRSTTARPTPSSPVSSARRTWSRGRSRGPTPAATSS